MALSFLRTAYSRGDSRRPPALIVAKATQYPKNTWRYLHTFLLAAYNILTLAGMYTRQLSISLIPLSNGAVS